MKILVVEDLIAPAKIAQMLLKRHGHDVELAASGAQAKNKMAEFSFDAIFMDFGLPDTTGLILTTEFKQSGFNGIVIGLTANRDAYSIETMKEAGLNACLSKPLRDKHMELLAMTPSETRFDAFADDD